MSRSDSLPQMDMAYHPGNCWEPVNELMRAIILRTIEDFNSGGELKEEALGYMLAEEEEYVFSFRAICRHLGFDPQKTYYQIANATRRISTRRRAV